MQQMFQFLSDDADNSFQWGSLGDATEGRKNLGEEMPVLVYRLFQYTMRDILNRKLGSTETIDVFRKAGELAGEEFASHMLDLALPFDQFVAQLQQTLKDVKVGILRLEEVSKDASEMVLSVAEDLDCSGLPITGEVVCNYDEGFIAGLLKAYTGKYYIVREVDCWSKGDRVCRFTAKTEG
jgi:predicted hydrocarbon binding protein